MNRTDLIFKANIEEVLENGTWDESPRPKYASDGKSAYSKYVTQVYEDYDISKGEFPITSLRPIAWKSGINEILAFYQEQTADLSVMEDKYNLHWWRDWQVVNTNTIGIRYGETVRRYDLINKLIKELKENAFSRRHILNLWQEKDFEDSDGLYPCAFLTMWTPRKVGDDIYLDMTLTQRASDYLVAGHINLIQMTALQMMIAHECNMKVGKFVRFTQNLHIYDRHLEQAEDLLSRHPEPQKPKLILNAEGKSFFDITIDDFELVDYKPVKPQLKFDLGI